MKKAKVRTRTTSTRGNSTLTVDSGNVDDLLVIALALIRLIAQETANTPRDVCRLLGEMVNDSQ